MVGCDFQHWKVVLKKPQTLLRTDLDIYIAKYPKGMPWFLPNYKIDI